MELLEQGLQTLEVEAEVQDMDQVMEVPRLVDQE